MESWTSRLLPLAALLLSVLLFAPQQFAYLVFTLMIMLKTVQAHEDAVLFSGLVLLLTALPVNGSILVVWVRNLAARWNHPFASDHNVFHCIGVIVWYEAQSWQSRLPSNNETSGLQPDTLCVCSYENPVCLGIRLSLLTVASSADIALVASACLGWAACSQCCCYSLAPDMRTWGRPLSTSFSWHLLPLTRHFQLSSA